MKVKKTAWADFKPIAANYTITDLEKKIAGFDFRVGLYISVVRYEFRYHLKRVEYRLVYRKRFIFLGALWRMKFNLSKRIRPSINRRRLTLLSAKEI